MIKGKKLGEGSYGKVYEGSFEGKKYAVKRIIAPEESNFFYAVKETQINIEMRDFPFITTIQGIHSCPFDKEFSSPTRGYRNDSYHLIFEKADCSFHELVFDPNMPFSYMQHFMVQMLIGLEKLHLNNIMHRDIKPSNILYFPDQEDDFGIPCVAKLCDFGLAKTHTHQDTNSPSVVTFCYRSPELCLGLPYDERIDVWALGCIFYEFIYRSMAGNSSRFRSSMLKKYKFLQEDDITLLYYLQTLPHTMEDRKSLHKTPQFREIVSKFSLLRRFKVPQWLQSRREEFEEETGSSLEQFFDLLMGMLRWDFRDRFTTTIALNHPFFQNKTNYVSHYRLSYPIVSPNPIHYQINNAIVREFFWNLLSNRKQYVWFTSYRIMFQALDMISRFLYFRQSELENSPELTGKDLIIVIKTFVYLAVKCFSSLVSVESFAEIDIPKVPWEMNNAEVLETAEQIEKKFLEWTNFKPYRPTVIELNTGPKYSVYDYAALIYFLTSIPVLNEIPGKRLVEIYLTQFQWPAVAEIKRRRCNLDNIEGFFSQIEIQV